MDDTLRTGTIISLKPDKGFGFITDGNMEYFFHRSGTVPHAWETLRVGQKVTFLSVHSPKGARADRVTVQQP